MKDSCKFLSLEDFIEKYQMQIQRLKYFGLRSAATPDSFLNLFLKSAKGNKVANKKLVSLKISTPEKSQIKWNTIASHEGCSADWKAAYTLASRCTKSTILINFQYRLLHRILPTNLFLTKIGIKQDPHCTFCSNAPENLIHLFWHCTKVKLFWKDLTDKLFDCEFIPREYTKDMAILLGLKPDNSKFALQLNYCFLLARHYIWCCRPVTRSLG